MIQVADFKRLGYFLQIAEYGTLSLAAERLNVAQPSLSRQMRLLEEELGIRLFTRNGRGMQLTDAGEQLRARITGPLRQVGHALNEVRAMPSDASGSVILGMPASVVLTLGEPIVKRALAYAPNISLQLIEGGSGHLVEWLQRGQLDAAILYGPATPGGLNAAKLLEDELVLVGAADADLRSDQPVQFSRIGELPLILPSPIHGLRVTIDAVAIKTRCALNVRIQVDSLQLIKDLVEAGMGYAVLPRAGVLREIAARRLTHAPIANPKVSRTLFVAMQLSAQSSGAVLQIEQLLRMEVANLAAEGHLPGAQVLKVGDR
jgi:DNA-binding transcriptional LysR family regulator